MNNQRSPYVFVEPFAGSAAVTYWLLGGKPPISYMGGKSGYSSVIADILGLSQHHKPAGIILGEPGPFAAVHATLGGASGSAEDVAGWIMSAAVSFKQEQSAGFNPGAAYPSPKTATSHGHLTPRCPETVAPSVGSTGLPASAAVANIIRSWKDEEPRALWERLKKKGWPSLLLPEGCRGRWLGPASLEDVAGYLRFKVCQKPGDGGFQAAQSASQSHQGGPSYHPESPAPAVESLPTFPALAVWQGVAEDLVLPADLSGAVIFADPPYAGTTKYKHGDCNRETVLRLARDWSGRGATVAISEAVRLDRELGQGWTSIEIGHARRGQKRTFGPTPEWVTLNREPIHVPAKQVSLFG